MSQTMQIAGLGEVLWDVFPDRARFGGAPANFACSAAGIGGSRIHAFMISAVGKDPLGQQARRELEQRHVDVSQLTDSDHQTGQVHVELDERGQASYTFLEDTAWDNLLWSDSLQHLAFQLDAVCFGTLGQRSERSRQCIRQFISATRRDCLRILDINLRAPYWTEAVIRESLPLASILKLNTDELPVVASILGLQGDEESVLHQLLQRYSYDLIALTRGAAGSLVVSRSGLRSNIPGRSVSVVDTVGAGDAFTAAFTVGLLAGRSLAESHQWADEVAAYVCTQSGGTPAFPLSLQATSVQSQTTL